MSKKKDSPALYELISKGKAKGGVPMTIPAWMAGGQKPAAPPPAEPSPLAPPRPPVSPPPEAAAPPPPAPARPVVRPVEKVEKVEKVERVERVEKPVAPPRPPKPVKPLIPKPAEKLVATEGNRLKLSITTTHAVAAGVVLLILIAGMFVLGRVAKFSSKSSPASPASKSPAASVAPAAHERSPRPAAPERREAPKPPPKLAERKEEPAKPPADNPVKLEKGKYYLVVQGLMGMDNHHRVEAEAIANFLNSNGEPVVVMTYKGTPQQYIVLSQRGFDSPDSPEAKKYMQAIEEQGKLYRSQGGKYDFNQGPSGWFVKM